MAVMREARRERHAGEIADHLALAGLDVEQVHPRLALPVRHVGDFLRRRREARRQHEIVAAREVAHIGAVLIHDREPLGALIARAGLVDEDDAGVEVAHLAGEPLIDLVGDDVREAAIVVRAGRGLLGVQVPARVDVPQPELRRDIAVALALQAAGHQRVGADLLPVARSADGD